MPQAVLAATIIVAVTGLIDWDTLREAWHYDKADALSLIATALGVMALGVEAGILLGVALSLGTLVWRSSHPHMAVVGTVPQGLPALGLPAWDWGSVQALWLPALLISLVGFVESVSVAQSLALKRQQRI